MSFKEVLKNFAADRYQNPMQAAQSVVLSTQKAKLLAEAEALHSGAADSFIKTEIKAGRMVPAERARFKTLFIQAAKDDFASPLAGGGSRLAMLKETQQKRERNGLTEELVSPGANETFMLRLGDSQITRMEKDADDQVSKYLATVS